MNSSERVPLIPQEVQKKKEPMSDAQIGDLLASIGNHEGKALLLASMQTNEPYARMQLHGMINKRQSGQNGWRGIGNNVPFDWCEYSLAPIGLVAREIVDPEKGTVGYTKTEKGEDLGQSFAGHLLEFSERHPEISLYQLFGSTTSKSKREVGEKSILRAPLSRFRLFSELVTRDLPIRAVDVMQGFNEDYPGEYDNSEQLIRNMLYSLSQNGILEYKSTGVSTPYAFYKLATNMPASEPPVYDKRRLLTEAIFDVVQDAPQEIFSQKDITDVVIQRYPQYKDKTWLPVTLSKVLKHFEKKGYLQGSQDFTLERKSDIQITVDQLETLVDLVGLIEKFREGDLEFLEEGREKARAIVNNPERFARLLAKAKNASPGANKTDQAETATRLSWLIAENHGISTTDLQELFSKRYGKRLEQGNIQLILREMRKKEYIIAEKRGTQLYYSPVKETEVTPSIFPPAGTIFEQH